MVVRFVFFFFLMMKKVFHLHFPSDFPRIHLESKNLQRDTSEIRARGEWLVVKGEAIRTAPSIKIFPEIEGEVATAAAHGDSPALLHHHEIVVFAGPDPRLEFEHTTFCD